MSMRLRPSGLVFFSFFESKFVLYWASGLVLYLTTIWAKSMSFFSRKKNNSKAPSTSAPTNGLASSQQVQ